MTRWKSAWASTANRAASATKIKSADEITQILFSAVPEDLPFQSGDRVALMVNGLGGTPPAELYVMYNKAPRAGRRNRLTVARNYVGEYCTASRWPAPR
jgi:phosphoenolpyruvate---glycerone phosphotransferase subunit DhaK